MDLCRLARLLDDEGLERYARQTTTPLTETGFFPCIVLTYDPQLLKLLLF